MGLEYSQVTVVAGLLGEGNTVPFIARYRKEASGGMNDEQLRLFEERLTLYGNLEKRRADILRLLEEQGVLTPELEGAAQSAASVTELEDIYRPYRPKKRTRATVAREQGLEPLAQAIVKGEGDLQGLSRAFISEEKGILSEDQALAGARDIIAEMISDDARVRRALRRFMSRQGYIATRGLQSSESPYEMYYDFREPVRRIAPHRVLAVNRGEKEEVLSVRVEVREDQALDLANRFYLKEGIHPAAREQLMEAVRDSWKRLLFPSLERELRNELTENAEEQALKVFKDNLRNLLMSPPVKGRRVLGVDPGYRTGCKLACVDQHSKLLETAIIYPTPPRKEREPSAKVVADLVERHQINAVAIGNGTAGRETEEFFAEAIGDTVEYTVVNEAGASVYSASPLAKEEFPDLDVAQRSAVSIARRLQDPMAELVKIDPKSIGVGQYQHDVNQGRLGQVLDGVVEACVNEVGVDLNTASPALLERVAGINRPVASNIVAFRNERGGFRSRLELREVPKLGPRTFQQCAGFLRLPDAEYYFDRSAVHPESYGVAERVMEALGVSGEDLGRALSLQGVDIQGLASRLGVGEPTLRDILAEMGKPGRDPRDDLPKPVFKKGIVKLEDLKEGMELQGIVRNVVDFGAFIDIGVHQDGLVHISQMRDAFVRHPSDVVKVGDVVDVRVLGVDVERKRISLSMKMPRA
ncbi:MAG: Tex family protein [Bacillota bacterium]